VYYLTALRMKQTRGTFCWHPSALGGSCREKLQVGKSSQVQVPGDSMYLELTCVCHPGILSDVDSMIQACELLKWTVDYVKRHNVVQFHREAAMSLEMVALLAEKLQLRQRIELTQSNQI
jgi:hypothetical protein